MTHPKNERTFVMVKPDGVQRGLIGEIIKRFERTGLKMTAMKMVVPTEEQCWTHYNKEDAWFIAKGTRTIEDFTAKGIPVTKEAIDDEGWFHTGDMGCIDKDNLLKITGRKKELFKTSFGKYIAPQLIENKLKESPFIDNIIVLGENQKFAAALIVPDFQHLKNWCKGKGISYTTDSEMIKLPRIIKRFLKEIKKYNEELGDTEKIMRFELMDSEWTIESGELTATLKLRRTFINKNHTEAIKKLFS